jgi:hypothetical protein
MMPCGSGMIAPNVRGAATLMPQSNASGMFPAYISQPVPTYGAADNRAHPLFSSPGAWGGSIARGPWIACGIDVFRKGASPPWGCSAAWGTSGARGPGRLGETAPARAVLRTNQHSKVAGPLTQCLN